MPESPWDPALYERFKQERAQPFHELAALVGTRPGVRVVDLGCGTGYAFKRILFWAAR